MRIKFLLAVIGGLVLVNLLLAWQVWAGSPDSPGAPNATNSFTLEDVYNRLDSGAAGTQSAFTEPSTGPGVGTMHTLNEIMGKAPAVDNTQGATPTQVISGTTFWGLNVASGQWGLQTGTLTVTGNIYNAGVPQTGQTATEPLNPAPAGSDGALQRGVAWPSPRFTDNGDGTVTDNLTGLIWLKNANCFDLRNWATALTDANGLASGSCGLTDGSSAGDWRLPNVRELQSLIDYGRFGPALPAGHPFTGVQANNYWSSSTGAQFTIFAWSVDLFDGIAFAGDKVGAGYVWPVRGGP